MDAAELKRRTKAFAVQVVRFVLALPRGMAAQTMGGQLMRCATSVGSNYRAACRARSMRDFRNKLGIVEEESDECMFWLEVLLESGIAQEQDARPLHTEANEILSIIVSSIKTSRARDQSAREP